MMTGGVGANSCRFRSKKFRSEPNLIPDRFVGLNRFELFTSKIVLYIRTLPVLENKIVSPVILLPRQSRQPNSDGSSELYFSSF